MSHEPAAINHLFKFALGPGEPVLTPESELWSTPLPASRHAFGPSREDLTAVSAMTHGDYFTAVQRFLSRDNFSVLCDAAGQVTGNSVKPVDLGPISVYLVKFGAFYHPSYIVLDVSGRHLPFVLNVAVSPEGRKIIIREYQSLSRLNAGNTTPFLPRVYGFGQGRGGNDQPIPMFLGQWFDGFYEFHLTGDDAQRRQVVVWDTERGHRLLDNEQINACMEQAACILTQAYNPLTSEAIGRWHHAAGDFVISVDAGEVALRLITVRDYAPIIKNDRPDVASILDALLLFFVGISMKLRLDRLDGVGRVACYRDDVVPAICRGFFRGLHMAAPLHGLPEDFDATVKEYVELHGVDQLTHTAMAIIKKTAFNDHEQDLLGRILDRHIATLVNAFSA